MMPLQVCAYGVLLFMAVWTAIRVVRFGFIRVYWRKRGPFRWHNAPGSLGMLLLPYLAWAFLVHGKTSDLAILAVALLTLVINATGVRLIPLLPKRDRRVKRMFLYTGLIGLSSGMQMLAILARDVPACSILLAGLGAVPTLLGAYLALIECVLVVRPLSRALAPEQEAKTVPPFSARAFFDLFSWRDTSSQSTMYGRTGPVMTLLGVSIPTLAATGIQGVVLANMAYLGWTGQWAATPAADLLASAMAFGTLIANWSIFEATLYLKRRTSAAAAGVLVVGLGVFQTPATMLVCSHHLQAEFLDTVWAMLLFV